MSDKSRLEARLLNASELETVSFTRYPAIKQQSIEQLKTVARRLREAQERAIDIGSRQQREMRGKVDPCGTKPARDNSGTMEKVGVLRKAIERIEAELRRREGISTSTPTQAELSHHVLELKLAHQTKQHPDPGREASEGMQVKKGKSCRRWEQPGMSWVAYPRRATRRGHVRTAPSAETHKTESRACSAGSAQPWPERSSPVRDLSQGCGCNVDVCHGPVGRRP